MEGIIFLVVIAVVISIVTIYNSYNEKKSIRILDRKMTTVLRWFKISNDGEWRRFEFEKGKLDINHIEEKIKRSLDCFYPLLIDSITEVEFKGKKYIRIIYKDDDECTIKDGILKIYE